MKKLYFSLFILLLVLLPLVSAVPPFAQGIDLVEGYEIKYPANGIIEANVSYTFFFHVFNKSNGMPVGITNANCSFHLYNETGDHAIDKGNIFNDGEHGVINEWEMFVYSSNFTQLGTYSYIIQCNSTYYGGFESVGFEVTPTGESSNTLGLYVIIYLILFVIIIFGYYIKNEWVAILGALGLIFVGIYTYNSGIVIFKSVATEVISIITIAFGSIIAIVTGLEIINNEL